MRSTNRRISTITGFIAALSAAAQAETTVPETVVTATRTATPIEQVGSSVTVITAADMERRQQRTVQEALKAVPGLRVVQLGGPGRQTSVFARGTNSNHVLVLIDGLEANDPSTPNGAFDFAHLMTENIDRIEVVRGPQSTLYGSDAIGAVINIITKKGSGAPTATARLEAGTRATVQPALGFSGAYGRVNASASATYFATGGETVVADRLRGPGVLPEKDASENMSANTRLGIDIGEASEVALVARYVRADRDLDIGGENPNSRSIDETQSYRLQGKTRLLDGMWEPTLAFNYSRYDRDTSDDPDSLSATLQRTGDTGKKYKGELQNDVKLGENNLVTLGLEVERDELHEITHTDFGGFVIDGSSDAAVTNKAIYLQDRVTYGRFSATIGGRIDDHGSFDEKKTYRVAPVVRIPETGTRLKAAYGTGFRAPALFELYGFTINNFGGVFRGNPALQPEESRGYEAGFEQSVMDARVRFGSVYFNNDIKNLISCGFTTCSNVRQADTWGAETFIAADVTEQVEVRTDYTFTRVEDASKQFVSTLTRRPKHKVDSEVVYRPTAAAQASLGMSYVGPQQDVDFVTGGATYKGGYTLFNLAGSYQLSDRFEVFSRVVNLLDRRYEVADGFRGPGLEAFVGAKARF
jgi:vitamin B12 transporter